MSNYSQVNLAAAIGIGHVYYSQIVRGGCPGARDIECR